MLLRNRPDPPSPSTAPTEPGEACCLTPCATSRITAPTGLWWPAITTTRDLVVRRCLAAGDLLAIGLALALCATLAPGPIAVGAFVLFALPLLPLWLVLFKAYGLYDRDIARINVMTLDDAPAMFHAVLLGTISMWLSPSCSPSKT